MKQKKTFTAYFMVHGAVIAAIYVVLTILFAPISFGPVQFRISEAGAMCAAIFHTGGGARGIFRVSAVQSVMRSGGSGCGLRKPGDSDRSSRILCS